MMVMPSYLSSREDTRWYVNSKESCKIQDRSNKNAYQHCVARHLILLVFGFFECVCKLVIKNCSISLTIFNATTLAVILEYLACV